VIAAFFTALFSAIRGNRSTEETELMLRIAGGDQRALDLLYQKYASVLFGSIISIIKKREEAEDLLQEIFIHVWDKAKKFDASKGNVYTWMTTLTRNKAIDVLRSKGYRNNYADTTTNDDFSYFLDDDGQTPLDVAIMGERAVSVRQAMATLPSEQAEVLRISYFDGLSQTEIADQLDLPLGTVKTRMRQGMIKLQTALQELQP